MSSYNKGLLILVLIGCAYAYPSGAPSNICGRYAPGHRNANTNVNNPPQGPYRMDVTPLPGGQYRVTLRATGAEQFKGFLIQGMQSNPTWRRFPEGAADIVGTFRPSQDMNSFMPRPSQLRRCAGMAGANVITHSDPSPKSTVTVTWTPPRMGADSNYKLLATVVRDMNTFYVVQSDVISAGGASSQGIPGTSGGIAATSIPAQTVTSATGSTAGTSFLNPGQGSGSFLAPNQGSGSFMFPASGSEMTSQAGMNVLSGDANTLTDALSTNLVTPTGSGSFFTSQDLGFSSPASGMSSQDLGFSSDGSSFSSQSSGFSSPGSSFSTAGSGFSSQDSRFNSMSGMSRIPGASSLPIIPNNVNFPKNFPTISGPSSEISSLSNLNINGSSDTSNFTEPFFTSNESQVTFGFEFIGPDSYNASSPSNDTSNIPDSFLSIQSDSILFSYPAMTHNSTTNQNFTVTNISSELAVEPPVALEMIEIPTRAPERISPTRINTQPSAIPTLFQPANTIQNIESSNISRSIISFNISSPEAHNVSRSSISFNVSSPRASNISRSSLSFNIVSGNVAMSNQESITLGPAINSSTYDPYWDNSSYPSYWDNSSFDPFFDATTIDPYLNLSKTNPVLPRNIAVSSNSGSFVNVFQPPVTAKPIQPPNPVMSILPPTTVKTFRDPNVVRPPPESSTVIPFQAPTKPKPIEIPLPPEPVIPTASIKIQPPPTVRPLQIPTTVSSSVVPTEPLPSIFPVGFGETPPKTILFEPEPPTVPGSLFPTADSASNSITIEKLSISQPASPISGTISTANESANSISLDKFSISKPAISMIETISISTDGSNSTFVDPLSISKPTVSVSRTISTASDGSSSMSVDPLSIPNPSISVSGSISTASDSSNSISVEPLSISDVARSVSETISVDSLTVPEIINTLANDTSLTFPFNLLNNQSTANLSINDSLITFGIDTSTTKESLEPLAYDPLAPPPPIFNPESFPTPVSLLNAQPTDSITVPITRPVASIDLPIRIDSPTIKSLPTGDVRVVLRSPSTSTTEFRPEAFMPESVLSSSLSSTSSSTSPTFEVISTSLSDVMGSVDTESTASGFGERPTLRVEPVVNVINVPVPSGQIAAVLNFSRNIGATVPTGSPPLSVGFNRFVTIGRPLGMTP